MKRITVFCLLCFCVTVLKAQQSEELYMPRNIKQAYQKETRAKAGVPGKNYWQNTGNYDISVRVNPPDRMVHGSEKITYFNHSPDTLQSLVFKLIINNHKPGAVRQGVAPEDYMTPGIHIDEYRVNGKVEEWDSENDRTWKRKKLTNPLAPGDSVQLAINWHYELSKRSGREGAIDSTTFYLAYFYPRVAVYDDYNGWDTMDFTGSQEFYNDFNEYTFSVTVPDHYLVWATGMLQNAEEVLQPEYARRLSASMESDSVISIVTPEDLEGNDITAHQAENTWKWTAHNVTDIAIAISNEYNWDGSGMDIGGRRVSVQAAYDDKSKDFHEMVNFGKHALDWFSHNWPGVAYPYPKTTIVRGFADMEYPMMVNDNSTPNPVFSRFVAEHELAHTWFPFYMGINESRYGFMDEGWATAFEYLIGINDLGVEKAEEFFKQFRVNRWINDTASETTIPIITPANILSGQALGNNEYGKAALGYLAVKDLLGDETFKKALQGFMDRWHGKHPTPWDMFYSFNDLSGQNLNWFWKNWFFSNNYIDLELKDIKKDEEGMYLTIENIGGFAAPVDVVLEYADGSAERFHQTPAIWKQNQNRASVTLNPDKEVRAVSLDGGIFMDADVTNNSWKQ